MKGCDGRGCCEDCRSKTLRLVKRDRCIYGGLLREFRSW